MKKGLIILASGLLIVALVLAAGCTGEKSANEPGVTNDITEKDFIGTWAMADEANNSYVLLYVDESKYAGISIGELSSKPESAGKIIGSWDIMKTDSGSILRFHSQDMKSDEYWYAYMSPKDKNCVGFTKELSGTSMVILNRLDS